MRRDKVGWIIEEIKKVKSPSKDSLTVKYLAPTKVTVSPPEIRSGKKTETEN